VRTEKIVGTLVPLSALHSKHLPKATFKTGEIFLDWLSKTKQSAWQLLPLHETQLEKGSPTKHVSSPYKGYGIGIDPKYLSEQDKKTPTAEELEVFIKDNTDWLPHYALFCTLRDRFKTDDWTIWDKKFRDRDTASLEKYKRENIKQIQKYIIQQWQLHSAFASLRKKAKEKNILLIGDIPFYLSIKSPLTWIHQKAFQIEKDKTLSRVSGVLAGPRAHFGRQVWGHPLYSWGDKKQNEYIIMLWKIRLRYLAKLYDMVRIDYANGFFYFGSLDLKNEEHDTLETGPGIKIFEEIISYAKSLHLVLHAEDSSVKQKGLREALAAFQIYGIRIFRFALNEKLKELVKNYAYVSNYPKNTVAYTTTHDTEPLLQYLTLLNKEQRESVARAANVPISTDNKELVEKLRTAVIHSKAHIVIIPIQDWLLTKDRINIPGTEKEINDPNWHYKLHIPVEDLPLVTY